MATHSQVLTRRRLMIGSGAMVGMGALGLAGCAGYGGFSLVEVVRRLLQLSANRAFDRLLAPGGFWDDQMARLVLPQQLGNRGGMLQQMLTGPLFKDRLARAFNDMAERAAYRAAPAVTEAIRGMGVRDALALIRGRPDEATNYLRGEMAGRLIDVMFPQFGDLLHATSDPLVGQALQLATGVDVNGIANDLARQADDAIWRSIGREEAEIRRNPRGTNDPLLERAFGGS
ncbi:DUF4197 domain-containing protein [Novosphingobium percolationis]|uniref:DUF4197 domain-containing protein n=1 Tax=Novosphingobium percolationis TaxID=2871811 RepID=UPI001CD1E468|nr:DUF4197 domain-containing protein [Novosphingobium percolationis]